MLDCRILTSEKEVEAIAKAWHDLYLRIGTDFFSDYAPFIIWWRTIAQEKDTKLHIVTGWREGRLVAVLPLVVSRKKGFRILLWAGYDAFLSNLPLFEAAEDLGVLWREIYKSSHYDAAELRYVYADSSLQRAVAALPSSIIIEKDFVTSTHFNGKDGEDWFAGLDKKTRSESRRKKKNLERTGKVSFDVYQEKAPDHIVQKMIKHKRAWCLERGLRSAAFLNADYIPKLVEDAATRGSLRLFCLSCEDKPISFALGFVSGKTIFTCVVAYDPDWIFLSPGVLVLVEAIRWSADNGLDEFSFMEGKEGFKIKYGNNQQNIMTYGFCRTLRGQIARCFLVLRHAPLTIKLLQRIALSFRKKKEKKI